MTFVTDRLANYPPCSRGANIAAWILQILLAFAFLAAAGAKLASVPMLVQEFGQTGSDKSFVISSRQSKSSARSRFSHREQTVLGALWLAATMTGATIAHLTRLHTSPMPALVLLALSLTVAWLRRDQIVGIMR